MFINGAERMIANDTDQTNVGLEVQSKCIRCHGLIGWERIQGTLGWLEIVRCVNCGDITDPVILSNRNVYV